MMISGIIENLKKADFYGAGDYTEIAKGRFEIVTRWKDIKRKIKRRAKS